MGYAVFPDNTVLCNFAAVSRLDLLRNWLRGRWRWCEAVAREAAQSSAFLPDLVNIGLRGGWATPSRSRSPWPPRSSAFGEQCSVATPLVPRSISVKRDLSRNPSCGRVQ
jgi:hypothetical protein